MLHLFSWLDISQLFWIKYVKEGVSKTCDLQIEVLLHSRHPEEEFKLAKLLIPATLLHCDLVESHPEWLVFIRFIHPYAMCSYMCARSTAQFSPLSCHQGNNTNLETIISTCKRLHSQVYYTFSHRLQH